MSEMLNKPVKSDAEKEVLRLAKNQQIKEKGKATKERREDMVKQTFELKVVDNKLSVLKEDNLQGVFRDKVDKELARKLAICILCGRDRRYGASNGV